MLLSLSVETPHFCFQKYDIKTGESIFFAAPDSSKFGAGYGAACGSCIDYCKNWPGESRTNMVATQHLSCKKHRKPKSDL